MTIEPSAPESSSESGRLRLAPGVWVERAVIGWSFSRSGGPGGQNVNKVNTRVLLRVPVAAIEGLDESARARLREHAGSRLVQDDAILIQCDESRSQRRNRVVAEERLRELVAQAAVPPKVRRRRRPGRAAIERRLERKRRLAEKKSRRKWRPD